MIRKPIASAVSLATLMLSGFAMGHGWTDFPKARQTICADDGGYWSAADGSAIPNAACRAAFLESGTYPFTQKNEFAANVTNYHSDAAVQAKVTDGLLCSAGSTAKAGMDIPSSAWQKTKLDAGTHTLRFRATAPHNPSHWRIYLTREGFDSATQKLTWSDLELINSYGNISVKNGYYEMDIDIPEGRTGTGILYVRWQRDDAAGEGFYNCSDIAFTNDGGGTTPDPDPVDDPELITIGNYVTTSHDIAEVGDSVRFRLFNDTGQEVVDERIEITASNDDIELWARDLALKVNDRNQGKTFIGIWHDTMNHLMYDSDNLYSNRVWAEDSGYSFSTSVIKAEDEPEPEPEPTPDYEYKYPEGRGSYQAGTVVLGMDNQVYECKPFPYSGWCNQSSMYYAPGTGLAWQDAWIAR